MTSAPTKYSDLLATYSFFCTLEALGMCHKNFSLYVYNVYRERLRALWEDEQQYKVEQHDPLSDG